MWLEQSMHLFNLLLLLSIMISRFIWCNLCQYIICFYSWVIFNYMDRSCFIYPFIYWWALVKEEQLWNSYKCHCIISLKQRWEMGIRIQVWCSTDHKKYLYFYRAASFLLPTSFMLCPSPSHKVSVMSVLCSGDLLLVCSPVEPNSLRLPPGTEDLK